MKQLRYSSKAKKDLKRYRNDPQKMRKLYDVLSLLIRGEVLPMIYRPHLLTGEFRGCLECHVESDFLLIWVDDDYIEVVRIGSHSELFR